MSALQLNSVSRFLGTFTLKADFRVEPGERLGVMGRSGSGKTTLLRIIAGLEVAQGQIFLNGEEMTHQPPEKRNIGFVFQDQALFPTLNVIDNITFALRVRGLSKDQREALAWPWLERVRMQAHAREPVTHLSGGEKQRVAFLRALIWKPQLLLLDEPFSALDAPMRSLLQAELIQLHQLWPVPLLLVTHDEKDLEVVATDRLLLQEEGMERRFTR